MKIWELKPPGTFWATPGLLRDSFTFYKTRRFIQVATKACLCCQSRSSCFSLYFNTNPVLSLLEYDAVHFSEYVEFCCHCVQGCRVFGDECPFSKGYRSLYEILFCSGCSLHQINSYIRWVIGMLQ